MNKDSGKNIEKKLRNLPKPVLREDRKHEIHRTLVSFMKENTDPEKSSSFNKTILGSLAGFATIAALVSFVFLATLNEENKNGRGGDPVPGGDSEEGEEYPGEETKEYRFFFEGESEHWAAEYYFSGKETWVEEAEGSLDRFGGGNDFFLLRYKGEMDELLTYEEITISLDTTTAGGRVAMTLSEPPVEKEFTSSGFHHSGRMDGERSPQVSVRWGESKEVLDLTNAGYLPDDFEEWEEEAERSAEISKGAGILYERIDRLDRDVFGGLHYDQDSSGITGMVISLTGPLDTETEEELLSIAEEYSISLRFRNVQYTEAELVAEAEGIENEINSSHVFSEEEFRVLYVGPNIPNNDILITIHPYTEEYAEKVIKVFKEKRIQVVEGTE
ncbi:hypothetical protein [Evansella clarkii]|uniref:hypothetical protein n=1 Tax=Evansella clarkii TaxID=79879 RepID=UPI000B4460C3|nr:hypothetical protein [Evansella clarkii]